MMTRSLSLIEQNSDTSQLYEPPPSLWRYIEEHAPRHELLEIKNLLGESLVEQSLELHEEAELLMNIWRDYRQETMCQPPPPRLPEPPAQREMLKSQIRFFIDSIQEKAKASGRSADLILSRHNSQVLDYVLDSKRCGSERLSSASSYSSAMSSRSGRDTPLCRSSSRLSNYSSAHSLDSVRASVEGSKNIFQFDDVLQNLREVLDAEVNDLLEDISFLQECLQDEADVRSQSRSSTEPTLSELREERSSLEKELLMPDMGISSATVANMVRSNGSPSDAYIKLDDGGEDDDDDDDYFTSGPEDVRVKQMEFSRLNASPLDAKTISEVPSTTASPKARELKTVAGNSQSASIGQLNLAAKAGTRTDMPRSLQLLLQTDAPCHVTVRTGNMPTRLSGGASQQNVVHVASIPADAVYNRVPVPPVTTRPATRPSTAQRFRNMVLECRDGK